MTDEKIVLEIRVPRIEYKPKSKAKDVDLSPEQMEGVLGGLATTATGSLFEKLTNLFKPTSGPRHPFSLEIAVYDQTVHFYLVIHQEMQNYVESQVIAAYPKALVTVNNKDYLTTWQANGTAMAQLALMSPPYFPINTWKEFVDTDPLSQIVGVMSKAGPDDKMLVQIVTQAAPSKWANAGWRLLQTGVQMPDGTTKTHPLEKAIKEKLAQSGFKTAIRLLVASNSAERARTLLNQLSGSFAVYANPDGNSFKLTHPWVWQHKHLERSILERTIVGAPKKQFLVTSELASLFHMPGAVLGLIPNISWSHELIVEPPPNLPIALDKTDEEKKQVNYIGRTQFKNEISTFGIKKEDRRRHIYIIGKSGTGKTTLIANMAIADMRNGEGVGLIDPHGDLCDIILDFIPSHRLNDVVYLDPSDIDHPFFINILEIKSDSLIHKNLVVSGIVAIFSKLYAYSWGPRLEYILRNAVSTLVDIPGMTLVQLPDLLSNDNFRAKVVEKLSDPVLKNFWLYEFNKADPRTRSEWISPILNKVGQFVSSPIIRAIIGNPKSSVDLERIMNEGKIIIVNLAQGKIGEDNATLLGAMLITKLQLYAMNRAHIPEDQRRDFFLYVDEFQNFATESFAKILSEARKYRLDLTVANQYIGQVPEELQMAIFGNVGTLISFVVGAADAEWLFKEFSEVYKEGDLVQLGKFQIVLKETIDGLISTPFTATTLPLPKSKNQNREKVLRLSREKFTKAKKI
ncbi:MAG: hypothetical protein UX31_C0003G0006 [Candidatus Nomurabacteria bacterium GW2011_GWA1_46_11]|uniref:Uncharacterized protein n=1 Tax=Candidatus Nomurabacteria bacterium GW2011_GWA1_46_11 TaxID=1618732 RepID=A0A0G1RN39_9BACT|nr:MAG: hypothetical protein UW73_C0004G0006 [Microgenomates group bacterium GW2011_GWB1_44_8]KKU22340.1 MAG: hypothetical protein UX31_C0003G0006 [Candidatus Nomurabacteria bacterium GW2011_GWA1_46_11]